MKTERWWTRAHSPRIQARVRPRGQVPAAEIASGDVSRSQYGNLATIQIDGRAVQPAAVAGDDEAHEAGHVLRDAETSDPGLPAELRPDFRFASAAALHLGADAPPLPVGVDQAWRTPSRKISSFQPSFSSQSRNATASALLALE
ncbi:MAG TPA: hypothetical protein VGI22_08865 [Xanthobacteraceae bacterium]